MGSAPAADLQVQLGHCPQTILSDQAPGFIRMPPRRLRARSKGPKIDYFEPQDGNSRKRAGDESSDEFVETQSSPASEPEPEPEADEMDIKIEPDAPKKTKRVKLGAPTAPAASSGSGLAPMPERFQLFFGAGDARLSQGIITRAKWSQSPVIPIPAAGTTDPEPELDLFAANARPQAPELVPGESLTEFPGRDLVIDQVKLSPNKARACERIIHLNTGFPVSSLRWMPCNNDEKQLLAVAVLDDRDDLENSVRPSLSVCQSQFPQEASRLLLYALDRAKNTLELHANVNWTDKGPVRGMEWRPARGCREMAIVTCSGRVAVFALPADHATGLTIPDNAWLDVNDAATCVSWLDGDTLLVGTSTGLLLEYTSGLEIKSSTRLSVSPIVRLVGELGTDSSTVMAITADGYTRVLDLKVPFGQAQALAGRVKAWNKAAGYIPLMDSFVRAEDDFTTRLVPVRKPSAALPALTRHSGAVQSVACSPYHPLVLSGATDGCLRVGNAVRRGLVPRRSTQAYEDVVLWQLQVCDQTGEVRVEERLELQSTTDVSREPSPKRAAVTTVDWLPVRPAEESWYAAGTLAGLVRVEKMC